MSERLSLDDDISLIEYVSDHKVIYDSSHPDHKNSYIRDNIWKMISTNIGKSEEECKKRWRSIRDTYRRYLREGKSVSGPAVDAKKNKWQLLDHLHFLRDVPHGRRSGFVKEKQEETDCHYDEYSEESNSSNECSQSALILRPAPKVRKRRSSEDLEDVFKDDVSVKNGISTSCEKDDDIDAFYKSIALSVKKLPPHLVIRAKMEHLKILSNLQMQVLKDKEDKVVLVVE